MIDELEQERLRQAKIRKMLKRREEREQLKEETEFLERLQKEAQ